MSINIKFSLYKYSYKNIWFKNILTYYLGLGFIILSYNPSIRTNIKKGNSQINY